ncbi:MAG: glycosyltransferase [Candidatus Paceibacterota bacterium]
MESFANLPQSDSDNLLLHIVAPRHNKNMKKKVFDMLNSYGLSDKIHFYSSMPKEKLVQYYQAADLFVSPSRKEGFGLAMAEAVACGTPVLATKSGGAQQIISKKLGMLIEANNSKSITKGIIDILKKLDYYNPSEMHHDISKRFSKEQKAYALQKIYNHVQNSKY